MLEGGIADKGGNEFEARWTLVEALRVLRGLAAEIRWEPFNEEAEGFEFRVSGSGFNEWHQCKRQVSHGAWTINGLATAGVLKAFAGKLAEQTTVCVFVSTDGAPQLEKLIEKAKFAETAEDFYGPGGIGKGDRAAIEALDKAWPVDDETRLSWLKRCRVEVTSESYLWQRLEEISDSLFRTPPTQVIDQMVRYLSGNLGKRFTRPVLLEAVATLGFEWRAHLDAGLDDRVVGATNEYLASLRTTIAGYSIKTDEIYGLVDVVLEGSKPITLVGGGAGSGKSVALAEVIAGARSRGWPVLAFRIDRYLDIQSLASLGKALLDVEESPLNAFGNRTIAEPALLVVDQVDAVSEASGRSPRMRDLFFRMVHESALFPNLRVVAACRSYDLDGDSRLEALESAKRVTAIRLKPLDWATCVEPVLNELGLKTRIFSEREQRLLSVPINLQLFVAVMQSGEPPSGELSSTRLFDKLLEARRRAVREAGFSWTPESALSAMAASMSESQDLTAPAAVLDGYAGALDLLGSLGFITAIRGRLQFSHESYFDHVFSRHFISTGQSVLNLLLSGEQRLFRRTQVRQIFSRLRDSEDARYMRQLREVLEATGVRYLVKDAVGYWLSEVDRPTGAECRMVEGWHKPGDPLEKIAQVVIHGASWLPRLVESGAVARWMEEGGTQKTLALWLLNRGSVAHTDLVEAVIRRWWSGAREERTHELKSWFERLYPDGSIGALEALYAEVIAALPDEAIKEAFNENFELGSWVHKDRQRGARVLGRWLRRWLDAYPRSHPFTRSNQDQDYWIDELAKHEPIALLEALTEPFAIALKREAVALTSGALDYPSLRPPHYPHDQEIQRDLLAALSKVAETKPETARVALKFLEPTSDVAVHAHLHTIASNGAALADLVEPLLGYDRLFKVGVGDADWQPFAKAMAAAMPHLGRTVRDRIEERILAYRPEYEWAQKFLRLAKAGELFRPVGDPRKDVIHILNGAGRDEHALLHTIGAGCLSARARARLMELGRKFRGQPLPTASGVRVGWVRSPISPEQAAFMSDAQWLRAMNRYDGRERHIYDEDGVIGGGRQLSSVLQIRTKEQPGRFIDLLERLPLNASSAYAEAVVSGIREADVDSHLVVRAVKAALRWPSRDFDKALNWTLQRHPSALKDTAVLNFVLNSAEHGEASDTAVVRSDREEKQNLNARDLLQDRDDLHSNGINGERGAAYEVLANALWEDESLLPKVLELVERRVVEEPLASVRSCMAHAINSIGKYEPERAIELLVLLVGGDHRILRSPAADHMLGWVAFRRCDVVASFAATMVTSKKAAIRAQGHFLESLLALFDDAYNDGFIAGFDETPMRRQLAAFRAAGNVGSELYGARAISWLERLFHDTEPLVRADTLQVDWATVLNGTTDRSAFVRSFLASPTFDDHSDHLMRVLEKRASQFPELTFVAVERVLALAGSWTENARRGHYSTLHNLGRVLVELYRSVETESAEEKRILDLFDLYLTQDLFDMRGEIRKYERH